MDPLIKYKSYHNNNTNIIIHKYCVPIILLTGYALLPTIALYINIFYSINYILFDVFSKKSIHAIGILQIIYISSLLVTRIVSTKSLLIIHILSWLSQIVGHKVFEKNTPAFVDNLYDSFLFAPYFIFLEIFYPESFQNNDSRYSIVRKISETNINTKTMIYFAGLFQKADIQFNEIAEQLPEYNHVFINMRFKQQDIFHEILKDISTQLENEEIECIIGYSFGGSIVKQFKQIYHENTGKDINSILISPGGFISNNLFEKTIKIIAGNMYNFYKNDKWYMIKEYPLYQNKIKETDTDIFILSKDDYIHYPKYIETDNKLVLNYVSHEKMISVIQKQKIIPQLIKSNYDISELNIKKLSSKISQLMFGGHFFPYNLGLWTCVSTYYTYVYYIKQYSLINLISGFLFSSIVWTFTEYMFHRYLLHKFFYHHHKKHHDFPNKKSIIHTPMLLGLINWFVYMGLFQYILSKQTQTSYYIFFPLNYLAFEYTHLLTHSYVGKNNIISNAKQYHRQHHFTPETNYSFVTPFWDYWFGSLHSEYSVSMEELLLGFLPFYSFYIHKHNHKHNHKTSDSNNPQPNPNSNPKQQ